MRILYITDGGPGGISSHVRCLTQCLKGVADVMVCITQKTDALRQMLDEDGTAYHLCNCTSGHDFRLVIELRRVVKSFKPDVIHLHDSRLFGALYLKFFTRIPRVCSIHLPSNPDPDFSRLVVNWAVQPCYWLPVSRANWERFHAYHPKVEGEVFFNPVRIRNIGHHSPTPTLNSNSSPIIGMVGRNAEVKDWPAFCTVARLVTQVSQQSNGPAARFWGVGVAESEVKDFGDAARFVEWKGLQPDGRAWIAKMDLLLLTSWSEEMPTVVLEAFQARTPVCGFIPRGGMADILALSNGALREVFIEERDCEKLAKIVSQLRKDLELRKRVVDDGWQILTKHFDAEKNCRGQLMDVYRRQIAIVRT